MPISNILGRLVESLLTPITHLPGKFIDLLFAPITGRHEVSAEMIARRHEEIGSWLRERITIDKALEMMREDERIVGRTDEAAVNDLKGWIDKSLKPGDELWYYDTGGDSWENLHGENGFAILRTGHVVDFTMWWMN